MKALNIDFVESPLWQRPAAAGQRLTLAGMALVTLLGAVALAWQWQQLDRQLGETRQAIDLARQQLAADTPAPPAPMVLAESQVVAINSAIEQLNTPWPAMLDGFERVASSDIALLQIEPDPRRRRVKGVAEAKGHQQMLHYLAKLRSLPPFVDAMVTRQEVNEKDANRPLRFMFEAQLDDRPALDAKEGEQNGQEGQSR